MSVRYIVETEEGKEKNVINLLQDLMMWKAIVTAVQMAITISR